MTQEERSGDSDAPEESATADDGAKGEEPSGESRSKKERMGDGIRQGIGVLSAFRDALEETIQEARDRGDLSSERARDVMKEALGKAQTAAEGARERLDFVSQADLDRLAGTVESLSARLGDLEEHIFGSSRASADGPPEAPSGDTESDRAAGA